ncbi:MAG: SDR family oxidoreductase [Firmicutes bacterium]|nr:SDR family oxidoreductase [Alicyclobacillaceae bacterium]MCL6496012.1 SDR family oxidoreductase [Bacillota bacterium]
MDVTHRAAEESLAGKVAIVTGAAGAIGSAVARRLRDLGVSLSLVDLDGEALARLASEFPEALTIAADVTSEDAVMDYVARTVERFGGVDLFFNNAGIEGKVAPITEMRLEDFERVMAVNVRGVFLGLKAVLGAMKRQGRGGAVVNSASQAGIRGGPNIAPYIASKHAVVGLTRTAALEAARYGVRVNAVAPGYIESRMLRSLAAQNRPQDPEGGLAERSFSVPWGRLGTPDDVARAVTWLLSPGAEYITGVTLLVDGGVNA